MKTAIQATRKHIVEAGSVTAPSSEAGRPLVQPSTTSIGITEVLGLRVGCWQAPVHVKTAFPSYAIRRFHGSNNLIRELAEG